VARELQGKRQKRRVGYLFVALLSAALGLFPIVLVPYVADTPPLRWSILLPVMAPFVAVSIGFLVYLGRLIEKEPLSIEARLRLATEALQEARNIMSDVEGELRARQTRLAALTAEYVQAQELASVNREAASAIRRELAQGVGSRDRRALWLSIATGIPIAIGGAVLGGYLLGLAAGH
jgi:hypothetical protein